MIVETLLGFLRLSWEMIKDNGDKGNDLGWRLGNSLCSKIRPEIAAEQKRARKLFQEKRDESKGKHND